MYGAKTRGAKKPKAWTYAADAKYDKSHGIKEGSPKDVKLDASRGLKDYDVGASLTKLRGGK